ncbi:MAG: EF-hand domain-containing protein [Pseudomonadota bacterium]
MRKTILVLTALGLVVGVAAVATADSRGWGRGGPGGESRLDRMFESFDTNGDGRLTQSEVDGYRTERHATFDTDGDGTLTLEEFTVMWTDATQRPMTRRFQRLDADANGFITIEEFNEPFARFVSRAGGDAETGVTRDDLEERFEKRRGYGRDGRRMGSDTDADG